LLLETRARDRHRCYPLRESAGRMTIPHCSNYQHT
jgi:hypothetical protein